MNNTEFFNSFSFNILRFNKYHLTDNSKNPVEYHYFGYLKKGTAKIETQKGDILNLSAGDVFYIPRGLRYQSHWFEGQTKGCEIYSFGFRFTPINKYFILQKIPLTKTTSVLFSELKTELEERAVNIGKLYYFFELCSKDMIAASQFLTVSVIEKATEFLRDNPEAKISDAAKFCGISESGIYILFKRHLGKTPNDIRLMLLCERAVSLLSTTGNSVEEISSALGFSSTSYFRKVLKKYKNATPLEIRRTARSNYL